MSHTEVSIRVESPDQQEIRGLIEDLDAYLDTLYEPEQCHHLTVGELAGEDVAFFTARVDGNLIGCGALRRIDPAISEIKRMYVLPALQGNGIGRQILAAGHPLIFKHFKRAWNDIGNIESNYFSHTNHSILPAHRFCIELIAAGKLFLVASSQ